MTIKEFMKQAQARLHAGAWGDASKDAMLFVAQELEAVGFTLRNVNVTRNTDGSVSDCIKTYTKGKSLINIGRRQGKQFVSFQVYEGAPANADREQERRDKVALMNAQAHDVL